MTSKLDSSLLNDTLNVVQLARQAALAKGHKERVNALETIADSLRYVANGSSGEAISGQSISPSAEDAKEKTYKSLLNAVKEGQRKADMNVVNVPSPNEMKPGERNNIVAAMADTGMAEVDIARQFCITREEVRAILGLMTAKLLMNKLPPLISSGREIRKEGVL